MTISYNKWEISFISPAASESEIPKNNQFVVRSSKPPGLIAMDILGVQPMTRATGLLFAMRFESKPTLHHSEIPPVD